MGLQLLAALYTHWASVGRLDNIMIKQTVVLFCLFNISFCSAEAEAKAESDPGYGHYYGHGRHGGYGYGHYAPRCHLTYEVVTTKECHAVPETVCHTEHVTNYVTKHEEQCATHTVPVCHTVVKEVPEEQCSTHAEQQCHQEEQCTTQYHTVVDTTYVEECQDIVTQHCTHTHVTTQTHSAVLDHVVGGPVDPHVVAHHDVHTPALALAPPHPNPHPVAKREADADAQLFHAAAPHVVPPAPVAHHQHPPQCQDHTERQCQKVPVQTPRQVAAPHCVPVPICVSVPRTHCTTVARPVPEQVCHDRPVTECVQVPTQVPVQVPVQKCGQV